MLKVEVLFPKVPKHVSIKFQGYLLANTAFMNNIKMSAKKKPAQEGDSIFDSISTGDR